MFCLTYFCWNHRLLAILGTLGQGDLGILYIPLEGERRELMLTESLRAWQEAPRDYPKS